MPAAAALPWITAAIGTGATIYSAKKGADAAKNAAQAQTAAGDKSLALQREMWQTGRQDLQPWVTQGTNAVNTMGRLMGLGGGGSGGAAPVAPIAPQLGTPNLSAWDRMSPEEKAYVSAPSTRRQTKQYLLTGDESLDPSQTGIFAPQTAAQAQTQSGYVQMRAPDGTIQPIASQYVDHFRQRGATIVG